MSKIDELIEKICPNGVKFEELKEICMVSIGEFVHKNKQREDAKYPVLMVEYLIQDFMMNIIMKVIKF